jgi:hypothetical protein
MIEVHFGLVPHASARYLLPAMTFTDQTTLRGRKALRFGGDWSFVDSDTSAMFRIGLVTPALRMASASATRSQAIPEPRGS